MSVYRGNLSLRGTRKVARYYPQVSRIGVYSPLPRRLKNTRFTRNVEPEITGVVSPTKLGSAKIEDEVELHRDSNSSYRVEGWFIWHAGVGPREMGDTETRWGS